MQRRPFHQTRSQESNHFFGQLFLHGDEIFHLFFGIKQGKGVGFRLACVGTQHIIVVFNFQVILNLVARTYIHLGEGPCVAVLGFFFAVLEFFDRQSIYFSVDKNNQLYRLEAKIVFSFIKHIYFICIKIHRLGIGEK